MSIVTWLYVLLKLIQPREKRLVKAQAWENRPKPKVDIDPPRDQTDRKRMIERIGLMYDMMHLALQTDSTRFITFYDTGMNAVPVIDGVDTDYHQILGISLFKFLQFGQDVHAIDAAVGPKIEQHEFSAQIF